MLILVVQNVYSCLPSTSPKCPRSLANALIISLAHFLMPLQLFPWHFSEDFKLVYYIKESEGLSFVPLGIISCLS